jgi:hypothetical protein
MRTVGEVSQTPKGKIALITAAIACIAVGLWAIRGFIHGDDAIASANMRVFIDSESGQSFNYSMTPTTSLPVVSPFSGKETGYPAELCYWTRDGQIKDDPTPVLLNSWAHPGSNDPTFCPDCGRLVVPRNPKPRPGDRPPPTREEYYAQRGMTP